MPRATSLAILAFLLTFSHLLLPCTSLSQDGLLLIGIAKTEWIYPHNTPIFWNWNESDQNPCGWNGISCDKFNTGTKIDLKGAHFLGNLTSAICCIPNLTVLILKENNFSHLQNLSRCKRLRKLNLRSNGFTGMLPSSISELSLLTELTLASNDFIGPFPDALFNCKRLRKLDLSDNKFVGALPSRISELRELRELNLACNSFTGSIHPSFGVLPQLESLFLQGVCSIYEGVMTEKTQRDDDCNERSLQCLT